MNYSMVFENKEKCIQVICLLEGGGILFEEDSTTYRKLMVLTSAKSVDSTGTRELIFLKSEGSRHRCQGT